MKKALLGGLIFLMILSLTGCTIIFQKGRRSDAEKIQQLASQLDELEQAKRLLESRLQQEISDKEVSLKMAERGLVITFVADILFDSGKDKIKPEALPVLDKVARVLNENLSDYNIGVEGHTDNVPIKFSGWKSNWELSSARALSVLHYLVTDKGLAPTRVQAVGYGEYHPVDTNDTAAGRKANRRVEIVVLPKVSKVKQGEAAPAQPELKEPAENLK